MQQPKHHAIGFYLCGVLWSGIVAETSAGLREYRMGRGYSVSFATTNFLKNK